MVTLSVVLLLIIHRWALTASVHAEGGTEGNTRSFDNPRRHTVRGGYLRSSSGRSSSSSSSSIGDLEGRGIREVSSRRQRKLEDYGDGNDYYYYHEPKGKGKKKGEHEEWEETWVPSPTEDVDGRLPESPAAAPSDESDPNLIPVPTPAPTIVGDVGGTSSAVPTPPSFETVPSPAPQEGISDGGSASSETTSGPTTSTLSTEEEDADKSCKAAQSGQVYTTPISTTIYYQYELLTERSADLTNVVWPAVDEAFQKFLSLTLVDCELGPSSPIQGVSPDPKDSFGTWYLSGRASSCTGVGEFDGDELFCDIVTGSVTLFLSPILYSINDTSGDAIDNETATYLELRNEVLDILWKEINGKGRLRSRHLEGESSFIDRNKGIYGLYFLSEPTTTLAPPETSEDEAEANAVESTTNTTSVQSSESSDGGIPIIASFVGLTLLAILVVGFTIHRRNMILDSDTTILRPGRSDLMDPSEFYSPDSGGSFDDSQGIIIVRGASSCTTTGSQHVVASNSDEGDISEVPSDCFDDNIRYIHQDGTNEADKAESVLYDFSQLGLSVQLTSPDGTVRTGNILQSRTPSANASPAQLEEWGAHEEERSWIADFEHRSHDSFTGNGANDLPETSTGRNVSSIPYGKDGIDEGDDDKGWTTRVIKTNPRARLITAAASEILSDLDRENDDVVDPSTLTTVAIISPGATSTSEPRRLSMLKTPRSKLKANSSGPSHITEATPSTNAEDDYLVGALSPPTKTAFQQHPKTSPLSACVLTRSTGSNRLFQDNESVESIRLSSPDSVMNVGFLNTPSPSSSSQKEHPLGTIEGSIVDSGFRYVPASSPLSDEGSTRTDFLKSRRRELEGRFLEYKQKLSTSISLLDESSKSGSLLIIEEVSGPTDNNDEPSPSSRSGSGRVHSLTPTGVRCGSARKGARAASPETLESTSKTPLTQLSSSSKKDRRRGSSTPRTPRRRQNYTSLNDIEDLLDRDQEWKLPCEVDAAAAASSRDADLENLNEFLSSRSYAVVDSPQYEQFVENTVQL